jgi:hypothetical protein
MESWKMKLVMHVVEHSDVLKASSRKHKSICLIRDIISYTWCGDSIAKQTLLAGLNRPIRSVQPGEEWGVETGWFPVHDDQDNIWMMIPSP